MIQTWIGPSRFGNAEDTIKYLANGEATDWIFGEKGIIAMSPELGADSPDGEKFYPKQSSIKPILETDFYILDYWVNKMAANITILNDSIYDVPESQTQVREAHLVFLSRSMNRMLVNFTLQESFPKNPEENQLKYLMIAEIDYALYKSEELNKNDIVYLNTSFDAMGNGSYSFSASIGPRKFYSLIAVYNMHFKEDVKLQFSLLSKVNDYLVLEQIGKSILNILIEFCCIVRGVLL